MVALLSISASNSSGFLSKVIACGASFWVLLVVCWNPVAWYSKQRCVCAYGDVPEDEVFKPSLGGSICFY